MKIHLQIQNMDSNISGILEFGRDTVDCTRFSFGEKQAQASLANLLLKGGCKMKKETCYMLHLEKHSKD